MRDVAADIAAILEDSSALSLTPGTDLFAGPFPVQAKGTLVGVMPLTGTGEPYADAREDLWTVDLEVTVRGEPHAYKATLDLALAVFGVLHRARAEPYVSILCEDAVPEWDGYDEQSRPVFTINLTVRYVTTRASEALVVLPSEGLLRVDGVEFGDGSTLTSAPPPIDLSAYATKAGTETLSNKTLASPTVAGPLMPATAGQQALGSAAVPWGPVHASAPVGEDAVTLPGGARWRYGSHPSAVARGFPGATNPILIFDGGIQTASAFINGQLRRTGLVATAPGNTTLHSHFSGRAAVAAGETQMTIFSNALAHGLSSVLISPRQIDTAVNAWAAITTTAFTATITLDAPASADWWFDFIILT